MESIYLLRVIRNRPTIVPEYSEEIPCSKKSKWMFLTKAIKASSFVSFHWHPSNTNLPTNNVETLAFHAAESRSEYLQVHWRENLGIEIAWETVEWAEFLDRLGNETPHLTSLGWVADYPDPDSFLRVSRARSWAGWQNATYDRLVEEAGQVICQGERMKLYRQADRILAEEAPILPLIYERGHLLVKPWVSRYPLSAIKPSFWKDVVIELH